MSEEIRKNVAVEKTWVRGIFMMIYGLAYSLAEFVLIAVIVFQFLTVLFTGVKNQKLLKFGNELSLYVYQIFQYLTFNSDEKAFPLSDWPSSRSELP